MIVKCEAFGGAEAAKLKYAEAAKLKYAEGAKLKSENPFSTYAKVSQFAFVIIAPLLFFLWGGSAAVKHFGLPDWVMGLCVALAIIFMLGGAVSYLGQLIQHYDKNKEKAPKAFTSSRRDNDYYDDYSKK